MRYQNLKVLRNKFGFTQQEVAEHLNISRPSYTQVEIGGREFTLNEAIRLSELYKCSLDDLVKTKKNKSKLNKKAIKTAVDIAWALRNSNKFHFNSYVGEAIKSIYCGS